jgi:hypothetical protein
MRTDELKETEALRETIRKKRDPRDPDSPTFGRLLDQGKLPVEKISADSDWY